jgi:hypothetical protein
LIIDTKQHLNILIHDCLSHEFFSKDMVLLLLILSSRNPHIFDIRK